MPYQYIINRYRLEGDERERAEFILGTKRVMSMFKDQRPDPAKTQALISFEEELVNNVIDRLELRDKKPVAILAGTELLTCYVGFIAEGS